MSNIVKRCLCFLSLFLLIFIGTVSFSFKTFAISGTTPPQITDYTNYYTSYDNLQYIQWSFIDNVSTASDVTIFFTDESFSYPSTEDIILKNRVSGSYNITIPNLQQTFNYTLNGTGFPNNANSMLYTYIPNLSKLQLNFGSSIIPLDPKYFTTFKIGDIDSGLDYNANCKITVKGTRITFDTEGVGISTPFTLIQTKNVVLNTNTSFNIYSLFSQSFANYAVNGNLNISSMVFEIDIDNPFEDDYLWNVSFYWYLISSKNLLSTDDWYTFEYDISALGTSLLRGATNFLQFEIFPGFSLLNLLYLIVGVPLLIAILKLFLGG